MANTITVELSRSIKYTPEGSGDQRDATFVTLREPTARPNDLAICAFLKQQFFRVAVAMQDKTANMQKTDTPKHVDITGTEVMQMFYASSEVDMPFILKESRVLFKLFGKVEDHKQLTDSMIDQMHMDDIEMILGDFIVHFIVPSFLQKK